MRHPAIFSALLCLAISVNAQTPAKPASPNEPLWDIVAGFDDHLFPAWIVGTGGVRVDDCEDDAKWLGDSGGLMGITIQAPADGTAFKVTVTCAEVMELAEFSGVLPRAAETFGIRPKVTWRRDELLRVRTTRKVNVTVTLAIGAGSWTRSRDITLHAITECPIAVVGQSEEPIQEASAMRWSLAAFVDETHAAAVKLSDEAARSGMIPRVDGNGGAAKPTVLDQLFALASALRARGVVRKAALGVDERLPWILVHPLDDLERSAGIDTVDAAVLLASATTRAGIPTSIAVSPGRVMVVVGAAATGEVRFAFDVGSLCAGAPETPFDQPAFNVALDAGLKALEVDGGKFADTKGRTHVIVDITKARLVGIQPVRWGIAPPASRPAATAPSNPPAGPTSRPR